jgi:hypothetical protein
MAYEDEERHILAQLEFLRESYDRQCKNLVERLVKIRQIQLPRFTVDVTHPWPDARGTAADPNAPPPICTITGESK